MVISASLIILSLLAGGCIGEKNKFKLPFWLDGMIVGLVAAVIHYVAQVWTNPAYWNGDPLFTAVIPFIVLGICSVIGWAVAWVVDTDDASSPSLEEEKR